MMNEPEMKVEPAVTNKPEAVIEKTKEMEKPVVKDFLKSDVNIKIQLRILIYKIIQI